jgi:hypothetical protein
MASMRRVACPGVVSVAGLACQAGVSHNCERSKWSLLACPMVSVWRVACPVVARGAVVGGPGFVSPFGLSYAEAVFVLRYAANEDWCSGRDSNPQGLAPTSPSS